MKEKTKFFKILSASICLILILMGFSSYTYASITDTTNTGKITVQGIEAGVKVSAYQLTTVNYDYTNDQPQAVPYTWDAKVKTWVDANYSAYSDPEAFHNAVTDDSAEAKAFYSDLAGAIKGGTVTLTPAKEDTATGTASYPVTADKLTSSVEFTGCAMGTYLILIENGYMVYTPVVVNLTPAYNNTNKQWELNNVVIATPKATNPQITKTVTDDNSLKDNYSTKDTISYKIVAEKPTYLNNSLSKNYYISDELSAGLTLDVSSIKVYGQSGSATPVELAETTNYKLTTTNAKRPNATTDDVDFVVEFVYDSLTAYDKLIVEYDAKLAQTASTVVGGTGNINNAYLDYSNNPYVADSIQSQETPDVIVYTYGAEITKTDKSTHVGLPGAEFTLSANADGSNPLYFVKTVDGTYYLANSTDAGATQTLVVASGDADKGKLVINGLDEGTYYLTETKAPEGYNIASAPATITITDANKDGVLDEDGATTGIVTLEFPNGQGFQLPVTGGVGTVIFVASGIVFVGLGILLLAVAIKKSSARK